MGETRNRRMGGERWGNRRHQRWKAQKRTKSRNRRTELVPDAYGRRGADGREHQEIPTQCASRRAAFSFLFKLARSVGGVLRHRTRPKNGRKRETDAWAPNAEMSARAKHQRAKFRNAWGAGGSVSVNILSSEKHGISTSARGLSA